MEMLSTPELIAKKRDGGRLTKQEIEGFVQSVVTKKIQDSQLGAMLMAIVLKGMDGDETTNLTRSMMMSGELLQWPEEWSGLMVDKHSTGGVGDKVSLPLAPALAACGVKVPMISGRGLGFTMGTLDKLEAIPGFTVSQSLESMKRILEEVGCCIVGQTDTLVPADKIMYATRDVTGCVESVPLIAGSIISKKAAESLSALILDVKYGNGGTIKTLENAQNIANIMVNIGKGLGVKTSAIISDMNIPLGKSIGHTLEIIEACDCLNGKGPKSLRYLVTTLGGNLLYNAGKVISPEEGIRRIAEVLDNGEAMNKWRQMLQQQGVEPQLAFKLCQEKANYAELMPTSTHRYELKAQGTGYVSTIDAFSCARVCKHLGAGRSFAGQKLDLSVGIMLSVEVGDHIETGQTWATIHHNGELNGSDITALANAMTLQSTPSKRDIIKEIIKA